MKFIIEGVEETGSPGLEELLKGHEEFFSDVDYIVISDNVWLSRKPALTYGTRGNAYFFVEVIIYNVVYMILMTILLYSCTKHVKYDKKCNSN